VSLLRLSLSVLPCFEGLLGVVQPAWKPPSENPPDTQPRFIKMEFFPADTILWLVFSEPTAI
jgi:hypothetical protein